MRTLRLPATDASRGCAFTQSKTRRDDTRVLYEADPDAPVEPQATSEIVNLGTMS